MIRTVAELLTGMLERERAILDADPVKHGPTIGEMYEGLSQDLLTRAIPSNLGLRLVNGFVVDGQGRTSGQMDCMLVQGDGEPVPYTQKHRWHVKDVIAVIEVKKSLYTATMSEALQHLREFRALEHAYAQSSGFDPGKAYFPAFERSFGQTAGFVARSWDDIALLDYQRQRVYHSLLSEHTSVLRIILGYHGFKSEERFRNALISLLKEQIGQRAGVDSFPQLTISGAHALVKANGLPYSSPLLADGRWPFLFSTATNPLLMLLECIWTRLDIRYGLGNVWGEDNEVESPRPLMLAMADRDGDQEGWRYTYVPLKESQLKSMPIAETWTPSILSAEQFVVISRLCAGDPVRTDDANLLQFLVSEGLEPSAFWDSLVATSLVARIVGSTELTLITEQCQTVVDPDLGFVAGENSTGQMTRWVTRRIAERRDLIAASAPIDAGE